MISKINANKYLRQYLIILSVFFFGFSCYTLQAADNRLAQQNKGLVLGPTIGANNKTNSFSSIKKYVLYKRLLKDNRLIKKIPSKKIMEYKDRFIISLDSKNIKKLPKDLRDILIAKPKYSRIIVNGKYIDTTKQAPAVTNELQQKTDTNKRLFYIQFVGPIKREWKALVSKAGLEIVSYVRHNALLIYADRKTLKSANKSQSLSNLIQWVSPHHPSYKIDNSFSNKKVLRKVYGEDINKVVAVIQLFNNSEVDKTIKRIEQQSNKVLSKYLLGQYINLHVSIDRNRINSIAHNGDVVYISLKVPARTGGERQGLILTNQYNLADADPLPITKSTDYLTWIENKLTTACASAPSTNCVNPFNFILDITDHPIDLGSTNSASLHNIFEDAGGTSRLLYQNVFTPNGATGQLPTGDLAGHGTFAAAIAGGFPNGGDNTNGYRHGLGIAPFSKIGGTQKFTVLPQAFCIGATEDPSECELLDPGSSAPVTGTVPTSPNPWRTAMIAAYNNAIGGTIGARISTNSWGRGNDPDSNGRYSYISQMVDVMTRDVDNGGSAIGNQEMLFVFLAGNIDAQGNSTLWNDGSTAKNTLVVGGTRTHNPRGGSACGYSDADAGGIDEFYTKTSWGPTLGVEPRIKPDLVAPASRIHSAITQQTDNTFLAPAADGYPATKKGICSDEDFFPAAQTLFMQANGTSFAAPAVAGMAANLRHWLTNVKQQSAPSPALLKAWLMNSSLYVSSATDTDPMPTKKQGMGRADQERALDDITRLYRNQNVILGDATTTSFTFTGRVTNKNEPLRFTLAWTDLPAIMTDGGLVNDLDLQISLTHAGVTSHYQGNSYIAAPAATQTNADSISYASAAMATAAQDSLNNVESITIAADDPSTVGIEELSVGDIFTITVTGESFGGDAIAGTSGGANAQDFALVVYNGALTTSTNSILTVNLGDSDVVIGNTLLIADAPDDSTSVADIVYTITSVPNATEGTLEHSIDGLLAVDSTFTQDDIDNSRISFTSNAANTIGTDTSFNFLISDSRGDVNLNNAPSETFTIIINAPPLANTKSQADGVVIENIPADTAAGNMLTDATTDSDPDGDTIILSSVTRTTTPIPAIPCSSFPCPILGQYGSLNITNSNGAYTYALDDTDPDTNALTEMQAVTDDFSYTITDGTLTATATLAINISGRNDAPTVSATLTTTVSEEDATFSIALLAGSDDVDNDNSALSVTSFACTTDNTDFTNTTGITLNGNMLDVDPNAYDSMQATESTTLACSYTITDSVALTPGNVAQTLILTINGANDIPTINLDSDNNDPPAGIIDFENIFNISTGTSVAIAGTTEIIDPDTSPSMVTITLPILDAGNEILTISGLAANLMFSYDPVTGIATLQPSGTLPAPDNAGFAAAIDLIRYDNTAPAPTIGTRDITIVVNDGTTDGNTATSTITVAVNPPELTLNGATTDFNNTFNLGTATPLPISNAASIMNGNPSVDSATLTITNLLNSGEESLSINGIAGVSGMIGTNINFAYTEGAGTGVLQLDANGTLPLPTRVEFSAAINLVRYNLNSTNPNGEPRIITTVINDGTNDSNTATTTMSFLRRPVDLALVLDTSGSMNTLSGSDSRLNILQDAVTVFLTAMSGFDEGDDRLATVYFNTGVTTFPTSGFILEDLGSQFVSHIGDINGKSASGWTALGAGLQTALQGLESATSPIPNRQRAVIVFTDGAQNAIPMVARPTLTDVPYLIRDDMAVNDVVDDGFLVRADSTVPAESTPIQITQPIMNVNGNNLDAKIFAIGTGLSGTNLETMMQKLGTDTGGTHRFTDMIGDGTLMGFFMGAITDIFSETSVDIVGEVNTSLPATTISRSHHFTLSDATQRASFVLSWSDNATNDQLAILLKAPNGELIPVGTQGVKIARNNFYYIVHLNFPLISPAANINAGGEWEMIIRRPVRHTPTHAAGPSFNLLAANLQPKFSDLNYYGWVLEDENKIKEKIEVDKKRYKVGESILLTAKLNDLGISVKRLIVTASVSAPQIGLGTFLTKNYLSNRQLDKITTAITTNTTSDIARPSPLPSNGQALDIPSNLYDRNIAQLLSLPELPKVLTPLNKVIRLNDNGKNGDAKAGDGIYSTLYANTNVPGSYNFNISVRGQLPINGNISRKSVITVMTEFDSFDIDKSTIKYSDIDPRTEIKGANKQLLITPVDKFGNLLGPGKSQLIKTNIKDGNLVGTLQDLGNGSYVQHLLVERLFINPVIAIDVPGAVKIPVDTDDEFTLVECLIIIILIVILILLVCRFFGWPCSLIKQLIMKP